MIEAKMKVVVFGVGKYWGKINSLLEKRIEVTAYMDNAGGTDVYFPEQWQTLKFDKIIICIANYHSKLEMMNQLLDLGVRKEQIGFVEEYLKINDIKIRVVEKSIVDICSDGVVVRCENEIEFMIAYEVFGGKEYGFHVNENCFCLDIGMNIGSATLYFASKENVVDVYGFEPCKEVYAKALSNISLNNNKIREKIHTYNIGLSAGDGSEKYMTHDGVLESAGIQKVQDWVENGDNIIELETRQASPVLAKIFEDHSERCFLKMDCEGAEYEILDDLVNSGVIRRVDVIVMEWHVGKYEQLEDLLKRAGFNYVLNKSDRDFGKCYAWK